MRYVAGLGEQYQGDIKVRQMWVGSKWVAYRVFGIEVCWEGARALSKDVNTPLVKEGKQTYNGQQLTRHNITLRRCKVHL
jgi:hypothetical protein